MSNDVRDWAAFVMSAVHLILFLIEWAEKSRRRERRIERFRSFRAWGVEWTAYDCEDDRQS